MKTLKSRLKDSLECKLENKQENKKTSKLKSQKGITLVALVVTIIILLILAGITITVLFSDNGIIKKAQDAGEKSEIAQIKEKADFVKLDLNIDALSKKDGISFIEKSKLISELKKNFEGSTIEEGRVVVKDEKYDIVVKDNLDIVVVKHGESYLKNDEIGITYEIEDVGIYSKKVKVYLELGGQTLTKKGYTQFANKYLSDKGTAELEEMFLKSIQYMGTFDQFLEESSMTREQFEQIAQEQGMTYDEFFKYTLTEGMGTNSWIYVEYLVQHAGGEGKTQTELENLLVELMEYPGTFDEFLEENSMTREQFEQEAQEKRYRTGEDYIKYIIAKNYAESEKINETITVQCSNGEIKTTNAIEAYVEFTLTENGIYTIVATITYDTNYGETTTIKGKRGEITGINIETIGRREEKFSKIYTETKEYVDALGNKAKIPVGFAVGQSDNINTIEKGLVITDSVDSEGYSNGNEFVWIPVGTVYRSAENTTPVEIKLGRYTFSDSTRRTTIRRRKIPICIYRRKSK